jgi:hypothetical protein
MKTMKDKKILNAPFSILAGLTVQTLWPKIVLGVFIYKELK